MFRFGSDVFPLASYSTPLVQLGSTSVYFVLFRRTSIVETLQGGEESSTILAFFFNVRKWNTRQTHFVVIKCQLIESLEAMTRMHALVSVRAYECMHISSSHGLSVPSHCAVAPPCCTAQLGSCTLARSTHSQGRDELESGSRRREGLVFALHRWRWARTNLHPPLQRCCCTCVCVCVCVCLCVCVWHHYTCARRETREHH
jgi:hypothetical protein